MLSVVMPGKSHQQFEEKRRHPRYGFQVHVNCRNVDTLFSAVTRNVSRGGCFIQTDSPLPRGTIIWLEFSFTDIPVRLGSIQAKVVWSTQPGNSSQGMGIEYVNVPDMVEELMDEFIDHVRMTERAQNPS